MEDHNTKIGEKSYEEALARLEEIVKALETGDLSLEESLTCFEEGINLSKFCAGKLDAAEGKIEILTGATNGELKLAAFKIEVEETRVD